MPARPIVGACSARLRRPRRGVKQTSGLYIRPALLLQLHDPHNTGLHEFRLRNEGNVLIFGLAHIFLSVSASLKGDLRRAERYRLDPSLYRRSVVAQHMQTGAVSDDFDRRFLAEA